mmetsp:Transcript_15839/g.39337  ORF Transcript_15839/g.39337 Transcript_15839/m.39337 type:complete len:1761 (-) Transcript_15839:1193-6475(-)
MPSSPPLPPNVASLLNVQVAKFFPSYPKDDGMPYEGTVVSAEKTTTTWQLRVEYEDEDEEDMFVSEVQEAVALYKQYFINKTTKKTETKRKIEDVTDTASTSATTTTTTTTSRRGRQTTKVNYGDYFDDDSSSDEEELVTKTKKRGPLPAKKTKKKKKRVVSSSSDEEMDGYDLADESEDSVDEDMDMDDEEDDEEACVLKAKKETKTKETSKPATGDRKLTMAESFDPINYPLFQELTQNEISEQKQYLDPCGMEASDDIISKLVGNQLDKIMGLFTRAMARPNNLGSQSNILKLGTACSGTDAPALALNIIQEQLELRNEQRNLFCQQHAFSCEQEPFKMAYLAKNFDSVLYPDIAKLTEQPPRDAFGQEQSIPDFNLFVAGTSCKDFSMLKNKYRVDIEDRGSSGETFLAAVDVMMQERPPFCILENVKEAPWQKMGEYISGAITLSTCFNNSNIKKNSSEVGKKSKIKILEFTFEGGQIVVDKVPSNCGVRCGVAVEGFLRDPESLNNSQLRSIRWPQGIPQSKSCTIDDIIKANGMSRATDTLVFKQPVRYHTCSTNVDTKKFGLPQTRQRTYMFVWSTEIGDSDLGQFWEAIVKHLEDPVRHSLEAFILHPTNENIRHFREEMRGPAGRITKRAAFMEPDFWSSTSANLPHNKIPRQKLGLKDRSRTLTQWGPYGQKQVPPHYWLELLNCMSQRELDVLEIVHASSARDAESHDSSFVSYTWNLSQNASKEKHRTATPGVAGCVTPGGKMFLPALGRSLLGCEKLLIQGIPYYRLILGTETEVQLGDLAGNAMSLTVVCATMLAAMTCQQLRDEAVKEFSSSGGALNTIIDRVLKDSILQRELSLPETPAEEIFDRDSEKGMDSLVKNLTELADDAVKSSVLCTCETSGQNSTTSHFLECTACKMSCCRNCCDSTAGYQLESHTCREVLFEGKDPGSFEDQLRNILPPTLFFGQKGLAEMPKPRYDAHDPEKLGQLQFTLHKITRDRRCWTVVYFAREQEQGQPLAEFQIRIGEISRMHGTERSELGVLCRLTSFLPAQYQPYVYGTLRPIAEYKSTSSIWKTKSSTEKCVLHVKGSKPMDSFRADIGLTQVAVDSLMYKTAHSRSRKNYARAKECGEERRWIYPENWEQWPAVIDISFEKKLEYGIDLAGSYERISCRQTFNQNGMWIRKESPPRYLYLRPDVSRTGPDVAVISESMDHNDSSAVIAILPRYWQPCDALISEMHFVDADIEVYQELKHVDILFPPSHATISSPREGVVNETLLFIEGLTQTEVQMLSVNSDPSGIQQKVELSMAHGAKALQTVRAFSAICVSKILQYAASNDIGYDLHASAEWVPIQASNAMVPFGTSTIIDPEPPAEIWRYDNGRSAWSRVYRQEESRAFHQALESCPRAFKFILDRKSGSLAILLSPDVVGHHAARNLLKGRGIDLSTESVEVSVRLFSLLFQQDPRLDDFIVPSCISESLTKVGLKAPYFLYERQQKVVTKMRAIENRETCFEETEMYEEYMPGSTGWSIVAMANRKANISGGVIADAIGAGKTVISIGMILKGLQEARTNRNCHSTGGAKSGATLVIVPPQLIGQWKNELEKFTTGLSVISIFDFAALQKYSVRDIVEADCVICPVDILVSKGYLVNLLKASGKFTRNEDVPTLPQYTGQKEMMGAKGTLIPSTSQDPYGGANNDKNQKRRDESAWYTHCYHNAIKALRQTEFPEGKKAVPLEYFFWERVIVDEIHVSKWPLVFSLALALLCDYCLHVI